MAPIERLTVTLPADMAALIRGAVSGGDYASSSEVIREALRDWQVKAELRRRKLEMLRRDIDEGMQDMEAGRLVEADIDDIMARGRRLSAERNRSA
jgi:antitoxin ParD1/3/4